MGEQDQFPGSCSDDRDRKGQFFEKQPQRKMKIQAECAETGIDWISQLPDSLIVQILSLMPVTDAFRTTILSKRWQYLWTCIDNLTFDSRKIDWSGRLNAINEFSSFTDNLLPLLCCSKIKKLRLYFRFDLGASYSSKIDKWLEIALKKKVEDVDQDLWYYNRQPYALPQALCSSSSILGLNCLNCRIPEECVLNWTSLKSLTLTYVFLRDEQIEQIASSCPQLESLELQEFCGFHHLHITSPKCRILQLIDHNHPDKGRGSLGRDCSFEIVAPYVQHLKILGHFDHAEVKLGDLSSLVHADLTFSVDVAYDKTVQHLLGSVRCANELMVPRWFIKTICVSVLEKKDVSLPLLECTRLTVNSWISKSSILGIGGLLRSTPYLENLTILYQEGDFLAWDEDDELDEDNSLSLHENIFEGSLQNLKNAEVTSNCCSCHHTTDTTEFLTEFLKSLLEHANNLEKLVIEPEHRGCNISSTNISEVIKNLLAFPRASNSAVVFLGSVSGVDFPGE